MCTSSFQAITTADGFLLLGSSVARLAGGRRERKRGVKGWGKQGRLTKVSEAAGPGIAEAPVIRTDGREPYVCVYTNIRAPNVTEWAIATAGMLGSRGRGSGPGRWSRHASAKIHYMCDCIRAHFSLND